MTNSCLFPNFIEIKCKSFQLPLALSYSFPQESPNLHFLWKKILHKLTKRFKSLSFFTAGRTVGFVTPDVLAKDFKQVGGFYHDNYFLVIRIVKKYSWPQMDTMMSLKYHIAPTTWRCTCSKNNWKLMLQRGWSLRKLHQAS